MIKSPFIAVAVITAAALLVASPAFAGGNSNVNVTINTFTIDTDRITEVQIVGDATYQFPDPFTAPDITEDASTLATGLAELSYPPGTNATIDAIIPIGTDQTFEEIVMSSHNPIDDPTVVIGDPNDYSTWIAIGSEDVEVTVEQTTTNYTFHRLVASIVPPCGDGTLDAGEECDDGNTMNGDCCSSVCTYEISGSPCDDGVVCTALDTCDGIGTCLPGGPALICASAWDKASLSIQENKAGKEKFKAKLKGGPALLQTDFGNPITGTTAYEICVFDDAGTLAASMRVDRADDTCAGKPCWKAKSDTGWQYKDKEAAANGVTKAALFGGDAGKTQIQLQAANNEKKGLTSMPVGITAALQASADATIQIITSDALCFDVTVDEIKKQEADSFKGAKK